MKVVMALNGLGLGGTEKAMQTHALAFDRERVDVSVVAVLEDGVRRGVLEAAGIRVDCADGDEARLAELFRGADIVHVFGAGVGGAARARRGARGRRRADGRVERLRRGRRVRRRGPLRLPPLPSKMCALRYRRAARR